MECPGCPEVSGGEWGEELLAQLGGRRYPFSASLELTERCNLGCVHCFINRPAGDPGALARELTLAEVTSILDQVADAGSLNLLLTGGEPLLRPDFEHIWRHAKRKGMLVSLFTNGTLLTPRLADVLAEWPPQMIEISLYGRSEETYERVTQVEGSYARCRRGIELALDRGLRVGLKSPVMTLNRHEVSEMEAFADRLGVRFRYDTLLWPRLDGDRGPWAYRLTAEETVALNSQDPERKQRYEELCTTSRGGLVRDGHVYSCGAGWYGFHVDAFGLLTMCMMARHPAYDLRHGSFEEGWRFLGTVRDRKRTRDTPCRTCTVGVLCTQCPGWSQLVHGDEETPVEYVCQVARLRAERMAPSS